MELAAVPECPKADIPSTPASNSWRTPPSRPRASAHSYQSGAEKLDEILDWCSELRIPAVTLWVFSTENLKRSQAEISGILSAIEAKVAALAHDPFMHQKRVRIQAIGRLDLLPESVVAAIRAAETATAQYNLMTLTIAVGYGGREEISDAVRSFLKTQAREGASL
jgi:short-chain Z-isoprenyl diphosphate synthase